MLIELANKTIIAVRLATLVSFSGKYMEKFFQEENCRLNPIIRLIDLGIYRICSIFESMESSTNHYSLIQIIMAWR